MKIYCVQFQLIELIKTEEFEHFLLIDPSTTNIVLSQFCLYMNMNVFFFFR